MKKNLYLLFCLTFSFCIFFSCSTVATVATNKEYSFSELATTAYYTYDPDWYTEIYKPQFVSENVGFKVNVFDRLHGNESFVTYKTEDGGKTWIERSVFPKNMDGSWYGWVNGVKFINEKLGFVAKTTGDIFQTNDGGISWEKINSKLPKVDVNSYIGDKNDIGNSTWATGSSDIYCSGKEIKIYQKVLGFEASGEGYYGPSYYCAASKSSYDLNVLNVKACIVYSSKDMGNTWQFENIKICP